MRYYISNLYVRDLLINVFKIVINSAEMTDDGYLKGTFSFTNEDDDKIVITYYGEIENCPPEIHVELPWCNSSIRLAIRDDFDLKNLCKVIGFACNNTTEHKYRWYFKYNLYDICRKICTYINDEIEFVIFLQKVLNATVEYR